MTYKVKVEDVSKVYDLNNSRKDKILSLLTMGHLYREKPYYALRDINFEVQPGESIGIIGLNGSGKSTLSDLLGEAMVPTTGRIKINGRSSLIAVSAGLNSELTGEENIRMKCLMYGLTQEQIDERYEDITEFSELGEFIGQPIKSYSSGMKSRLGFSIAIHTDPDVLIVDEALSVGDETFSDKCMDRMKQFQKAGKTIFFVSHSGRQVLNMCDKVMWLHCGEIQEFGESSRVVEKYAGFIDQFNDMSKAEQLEYKEKMFNHQQRKGEQVQSRAPRRPFITYVPAAVMTAILVLSILIQGNLFSF